MLKVYCTIFCFLVSLSVLPQTKMLKVKIPLGHSDDIRAFDVSYDEKMVATAGSENDLTIIIWDIRTGKELVTFFFDNPIYNVFFLSDNKSILAVEESGFSSAKFSVWDIKSKKLIRNLSFTGNRNSELSPIKDFLIVPNFSEKEVSDNHYQETVDQLKNKTAILYDVKNNKIISSFSLEINAKNSSGGTTVGKDNENEFEFIKTQNELFLITAEEKVIIGKPTIKIFSINNLNKPIKIISHNEHINKILATNKNGVYAIKSSKEITFWDINSENSQFTIDNKLFGLKELFFSEDGTILIGYSNKKDNAKIILWDVTKKAIIKEIKMGKKTIAGKLCLINSNKIIAYSKDKSLVLIDMEGNIINELKGHVKEKEQLYFSEDESLLIPKQIDIRATINEIERAKVFLEKQNQDVTTINEALSKIKNSSPDDYIVDVWDLNTGVSKSLKSGVIKTTTNTISKNKNFVCINIDKENLLSQKLKKITQPTNPLTASDSIYNVGLKILNLTDLKKGKIQYLINKFLKDTVSLIALDSLDWIIVNKKGYYKCSRNAAKLLHYVSKNNDVISFEQLDLKYNRPDLILKSLGSKDIELIEAYKKTYLLRLERNQISESELNDTIEYPEVDFVERENIDINQKTKTITLKIKSNSLYSKLLKYNIWVNEVPIYGQKGISIKNNSETIFSTSTTFDLSDGKNKIEVSITTKNGIESLRKPLYLNYTPEIKSIPKTWFIGFATNHYNASSKNNLKYSIEDVKELANKFKFKLNSNLEIDTLFNSNFTKENILLLKKKLLKTNINDNIIIVYSGHGELGTNNKYYFPTSSMTTLDFKTPEIKSIPYELIEHLVDNIPARNKLFLIDACNSGILDKNDELVYNDSKMASQILDELYTYVGRGSGTTVITSSSGYEISYESLKYKHGFFTKSILNAFEQFETITVEQLKKYIVKQVPILSREENSKVEQTPSIRSENKETNFKIW